VASVHERTMQVNGLSVNFAEAGSGPPVVLLHGFPDSWRLWQHQIDALADAGHRVIAPDLRGFGQTERPDRVEDYAMRHLVADFVGLVDALGLDRVAVVGHDWGAALAWRIAASLQGRVSRLAVVSVGHPLAVLAAGLPQRQLSWYMLWFLFPGVAERVLPENDWAFYRQWAWGGAERGDDPDLDRQLADLSRPGALVAGLNYYRANIDPARFVQADLARTGRSGLGCPTMGVWSSADVALGEIQMTGSADYVAGPWRYERIDGVGHWVPVHAPERLSALLVDFLGDTRLDSSPQARA
jgi:pimeloyl-ACP methyl ester carboxylesterase